MSRECWVVFGRYGTPLHTATTEERAKDMLIDMDYDRSAERPSWGDMEIYGYRCVRMVEAKDD